LLEPLFDLLIFTFLHLTLT